MPDTTIRPMVATDRAAVHSLLRSHRLPLQGFDDPHVVALVAQRGDEVIGCAAVEVYGSDGLLRSVAVADAHRGRALGTQLTRAAMTSAAARGLTTLYLLTETASGFFPKLGFALVARDRIPERVKQSVEFTSVCPATAQAFQLSLERNLP
jgi:amino-acid N-acetyltransferase